MKFIPVEDSALDPPPAGFRAIDDSLLDPEPEVIGPGETFALNATNVFGAGPVIAAALHHIVNGVPYDKFRDAYSARIQEANAQNPKAALAGKIGSLAPEAILGGAVGKVAAAGSKAIGLTAKAAPLVAANPLIASVLEGGAAGAAYGAASGAGEAASKGESIGEGALGGAAGGAAVGGAFGAATGLLSKAARGAVERADKNLVPGVTDALAGSERSEVVSALRKDPELRRLASKPTPEAIKAMEERAASLTGKADELIAQIGAKAPGLQIGKFASAIDAEIARVSKDPLNEGLVSALEKVKDSALKSWLPEDLASAMNSQQAKESELLRTNLLKRRDAQTVPLAKLESLSRDIPSKLPGSPEVKAHVESTLRAIRDAHLTDVASKVPEIKSAADTVRDLDRDFSVIKTITGALRERPAGDHGGGIEKLISLFTHHGPVGAGIALASGHPIPAAVLAAPAVARKGDAALAFLQREAANGNAKAIRILKAAEAARTVGTAATGAVGSAQSGTLAEQLP